MAIVVLSVLLLAVTAAWQVTRRGGCPSVDEFHTGDWPPGCWRPYADSSPFNRKIPSSARVGRGSERIVRRVLTLGPIEDLVVGEEDTPRDFSHPTYYATADDPAYRVTCTMSRFWGRCEPEGRTIRIPRRARPAGGSDGHMAVVDPRSRWEYDFWRVKSKTPGDPGRLTVRYGGRTRVDGDGLGSAATAANFGLLAGPIRAQEVERGRIEHALFMVVHCTSGDSVYPARKTNDPVETPVGRPCRPGEVDADAPPMGARFQLDMSPSEIDHLDGLPDWKKTILKAMAEYGMYVGDTGGESWAIQAESDSTYTSFGARPLWRDFARDHADDGFGAFVFGGRMLYGANLNSGVPWSSRLRLIDPCVTRRTC